MKSLVRSALPALLIGGLAAPVLADEDPVAGHTISVDEATKGLKGPGTLEAKIEIEQGGKSLGTFTCELFEQKTPKTVANFVGLARGTRPFRDVKTGQWVKRPFYDGLTFHRVIPGFMIQGGDPQGNGTGNPGYRFEDEFVSDLKFDKTALLAMANAGPTTNGSQFFITEGTPDHHNGRHTIFGACTPADLVKTIARVPTGPRNLPNDPVVMKKVTIQRTAKKK